MGNVKGELPPRFKTRLEQLIFYAAAAGELSSDLYKVIGISDVNYRMQLSKLRNKNVLKTIKSDALTGYVLTNAGKRNLKKDNRYSNIIKVANNNVVKRKRMQLFSKMYAVLDLQGFEYETYLKPVLSPPIPQSITEKERYFYTAKEFKDAQDNNGITIKGSKSYGVLITKNKVIPVYMTAQALPEFYATEFQYIQTLKRYFYNSRIDSAVMFCSDVYSMLNISGALINFNEIGEGRNITDSGYYTHLFLIPYYEHTKLLLWSLYNENKLKQLINQKEQIVSKKTLFVNDGFKNNIPVLYMLNFDVVKLNMFFQYIKISNSKAIIITFDFFKDIIIQLANNPNIRVVTINSKDMNERCDL